LRRSSVQDGAIVEGIVKSKQVPETSSIMTQDRSDHGPLAGELMDLYVAMIIVIPIAFALKSLWV
tara:strand:- start:883 stop:1077 length:195 start_codon:yes stop_codon:yes gene_type:complete